METEAVRRKEAPPDGLHHRLHAGSDPQRSLTCHMKLAIFMSRLESTKPS